jgi:hypothetical protein
MKKLMISPGDKFGSWFVIRELDFVIYQSGHRERLFEVECGQCGKLFCRQLRGLRAGSIKCRECAKKRAVICLAGPFRSRLLTEVLREHHVTRDCYDQRRHRGWSKVRAATTPTQKGSQ